jgi:hypothetical protein
VISISHAHYAFPLSSLSRQLLANSDKLRDAEEALNKIRGRHEDIQRLAKSLAELHEMFTDLALMIHQQVRDIMNSQFSTTHIYQSFRLCIFLCPMHAAFALHIVLNSPSSTPRSPTTTIPTTTRHHHHDTHTHTHTHHHDTYTPTHTITTHKHYHDTHTHTHHHDTHTHTITTHTHTITTHTHTHTHTLARALG